MIVPTIGRVVWYHPNTWDPGGTLTGVQAAHIAFVHNKSSVNLMVIDSDGNPYSRTSVYLLQEKNEIPPTPTGYAEWMPYQRGQAAKTEQLEAQLRKKEPAPEKEQPSKGVSGVGMKPDS